jgi:hypothetical protein
LAGSGGTRPTAFFAVLFGRFFMRIYIGFDDTDTVGSDRGTGKVARWFEHILPEGCRLWGVVRQQLLRHESIPFTSHNSAACIVVDMADPCLLDALIGKGAEHLQ